ncbi:site-specific integrase [Oscillospiraceae bacterium OttesenSCG-928-G22]|nr:site-specific integrase [Oscillospiraceae bacterium OttesenSCG-928-G22]
MAINTRVVKNKSHPDGSRSGRKGTVYDVILKFKVGNAYEYYTKKGFLTRNEAKKHEVEIKAKYANRIYSSVAVRNGKQLFGEYLHEWLEIYKVNLRPSTYHSYKSIINIHLIPHMGNVPLNQLTPNMFDTLFEKMRSNRLSYNTLRNVQRVSSVSLESARKYGKIERNPARDKLTKFSKDEVKPDPYTIEQMQQLLMHAEGTEYEMPVILAGLYGMRLGEVLALR